MKEIETRIAKFLSPRQQQNWNGGVFPNPSTQTVLQAISGWLLGNSLFFPLHMKEGLAFTEIHPWKEHERSTGMQIDADLVCLDVRGHGSSLWFDRADLCEHWHASLRFAQHTWDLRIDWY
jgi:hypothetical protein